MLFLQSLQEQYVFCALYIRTYVHVHIAVCCRTKLAHHLWKVHVNEARLTSKFGYDYAMTFTCHVTILDAVPSFSLLQEVLMAIDHTHIFLIYGKLTLARNSHYPEVLQCRYFQIVFWACEINRLVKISCL